LEIAISEFSGDCFHEFHGKTGETPYSVRRNLL
jgi:hypothetical protein